MIHFGSRRHVNLLVRFAALGIPLGRVLLPWGRIAVTVGLLLLSSFAVSLIRLLVDIARELKADSATPGFTMGEPDRLPGRVTSRPPDGRSRGGEAR